VTGRRRAAGPGSAVRPHSEDWHSEGTSRREPATIDFTWVSARASVGAASHADAAAR